MRARPDRLPTLLVVGVALAVLAAACAGEDGGVDAAGSTVPTTADPDATAGDGLVAGATTTTSPDGPAAPVGPPPTRAPTDGRGAMGRYPERVYVPNTRSDSVQVIDPATCAVIDTFAVGHVPHHITPAWDLEELYVFNTEGNSLTVIDPVTGRPSDEIPVEDPYNLYFTPDGSQAIVVAERLRRLDFRHPDTWELIASVPVEPPGVDHLGFSRDGSYLVASTEFSGYVAKVDVVRHELVGLLEVGGAPIDVVRDPVDDPVMYVANQERHGVHVIDTAAMQEIGFVPTGTGAHGLLLSKDKTQLYVSNRLEGSISVIDLASRQVVSRWETGGSPDMGLLNPSGDTLWIANRYHASVMAVDTATGQVRCRVPTEAGPHGLTYFPTPGVHSIGHNGVMIDEEGNVE